LKRRYLLFDNSQLHIRSFYGEAVTLSAGLTSSASVAHADQER